MTSTNESNLKIGKAAFFMAIIILLLLMIVSGILSITVPSGEYDRVIKDGREIVVPESFHLIEKPAYPVWRWFTAPVEVLFAKGNIPIITIMLFIVFVGGSFTILEKGKLLEISLGIIVKNFQKNKYRLMAIIMFVFMFVAAVLGIYESMVPLIVFIVPLALALGWDSLTGLGLSLLPLSFGFSAAITNPFSIGVAQKIAELPLFSGAWLRIIFFVFVYVITLLFVRRYAKKIEKNPEKSMVFKADEAIRQKYSHAVEQISKQQITQQQKRGLLWFICCLGAALLFVLVTSRMTAISQYSFPLMALLFLIGGIGAGKFIGFKGKKLFNYFLDGVKNVAPGLLLIMMAMSVKHIIDNGGITDTILHEASLYISGTSSIVAAFLIYLLTLFMDFFIGSASAKAFLMMPILAPLSDLVGVTRQTTVLAFDIGDGFSNMLYPSNALLLIGLGFTVVGYTTWIKWTIKIQGIIFILSMLFLALAVAVNYGPF